KRGMRVPRLACGSGSKVGLVEFVIMNRLVVLAALTVSFSAPVSAADKPNIVFILADDLGWTDLGCQGSKYYESPNIDRLASQGMRLTSYYHCENSKS